MDLWIWYQMRKKNSDFIGKASDAHFTNFLAVNRLSTIQTDAAVLRDPVQSLNLQEIFSESLYIAAWDVEVRKGQSQSQGPPARRAGKTLVFSSSKLLIALAFFIVFVITSKGSWTDNICILQTVFGTSLKF